jgi:penicillin-binding protein 1B
MCFIMIRAAMKLLKRHRRRILASVGIVLSVATMALGIWVFKLDRQVTRQFEGRRWTLPAQVYAQPAELFVGRALSADALEQSLRRLGYQRVEKAELPGSYSRQGPRIDLVSRRFQFWDALQEPARLTVSAIGNTIVDMRDSRQQEVPLFRLDPLLIGSIFPMHGEDRVVAAPEEVPELLPAALKVVEDRKFESHRGVNPSAILRAAIVNVRAGQIEQGGSTLTQQLVKSYFLDNRRTLGRKIEEALMAVLLERRFSKPDLMNAYINEIYLGQDGRRAIHGFGLASQFYFGKPLAELQLHEVALLVAVVRGPSYYDPRRNPKRAVARRDLVLKLMANEGVITPEDAKRAADQPLAIVGAGKQAASSYYPAFLDLVRRTLRRDYREEDLTETGLRIFSTLDPLVQAQAERALSQELDQIDEASKAGSKSLLEGVVIVTAPQSGEVIALVGGRKAGFAGFNRALDASRSIGSLVKPVVYLTAIETGQYNAASIIEDAPVSVKLANGKKWEPQNISKESYGPVPLVRALAQSLNQASVNLGMAVGLPKVTRKFVALGMEKEPAQLPALLLGSIDLSPLEVAQLYNAFGNGGFSTPLRAVRSVVDSEGQPLKSFALEVTPVADPAAVYQVNRMMVNVMEQGSGRGARAVLPPGLVVAGKSGTSSDNRDSWFAGFSGSHLAVVWIGHDDNSSTGLTGSSGALPVWSRLMAGIETTSWNALLPEDLAEEWMEFPSGLGAREDCGDQPIVVAVPRGTELQMQPACEEGALEGLGGQIRDWWREVTQQ